MSTVESTSWSPQHRFGAALLWLWVVVPFGYGLYQLVIKIPALFGS